MNLLDIESCVILKEIFHKLALEKRIFFAWSAEDLKQDPLVF